MRADSQVENPFSTLSSYLTVQYYSTKTNNYYLSQKGSHIQHIQHIQRQVGSGKCTLLRPLETYSRFHFATKHVVRESLAGWGQGWPASCSLGWSRGGTPFSLPCLYKIMRGQLRVGEMHTSTATRDSRSVSFCHKTCSKRKSSRVGAGVAGFVLVGVVEGGHAFFAPMPIQNNERSTSGRGNAHFYGH